MTAKAMSEAERKERSAMQKVVGRKLYKKEFLDYKQTLNNRGVSVAEACENSFEANYMRLCFALNADNNKKKKEGK